MKTISDRIFPDIIAELYDVPIMGNVFRPHYVERMIVIGLGDGFRLVSADWAGWDVESSDGTRIEIKQSAARQTWTAQSPSPSKPSPGAFDIAPRKGYFDEGSRWIEQPGRQADIYILAWHPIAYAEDADHRDPAQWRFFIVPSRELPPQQKTIARSVVEKSWPEIFFDQLRPEVLKAISRLKR